MVNLSDGGPPVRGTLWSARGPLLVLKGASVVVSGEATPVDGEVVVERDRIAFVQVTPG